MPSLYNRILLTVNQCSSDAFKQDRCYMIEFLGPGYDSYSDILHTLELTDVFL